MAGLEIEVGNALALARVGVQCSGWVEAIFHPLDGGLLIFGCVLLHLILLHWHRLGLQLILGLWLSGGRVRSGLKILVGIRIPSLCVVLAVLRHATWDQLALFRIDLQLFENLLFISSGWALVWLGLQIE